MLIDFDEVNYLIYRYFLEQGYEHSAFALNSEARIANMKVDPDSVPMGLLINVIQKALQMIDIELHLDSKGNLHKCTQPIAFLKQHNCASINVANQLIPREPLRMITVQHGERVRQCLDELPKPILTPPQRSMELIYGYKQHANEAETLYKAQIVQESQKKLQEIEEKRQEQTVASKLDMEQAMATTDYVLSQLQIPKLDAREVQTLQRHIQINQTAPEITEETILQDKPRYQELKFYYPLTESPIGAVATIPANKLITQQCTCKELLCNCSGKCTAPELDNIHLHFAGSESGQLFFGQADILTHQLKMSRDLMANQPEKGKIIAIVPLAQRNRAISVQANGAISVFKLNFQAGRITLSLLYCGHPLGYFQVTGIVISPPQDLLVLIGKSGAPLILDLVSGQQVRQSPDDKFNKVTEDDGFCAIDRLGNLRADAVLSATPTDVIDCCFISANRFAFIRGDGTFQVLEIKQQSQNVRGYEVEYAKFMQETPTQLALFGDILLVTTKQKCLYACYLDQKLETHQIKTEFDILRTCVVQGKGFVCLSTQGHLFLFSEIDGGEPKITMDWGIDISGPARLFSWNELAVVADDSHVFRIDVTREDIKQGAVDGHVISADVGEGVGIYGLACGSIGMEQRIQATL